MKLNPEKMKLYVIERHGVYFHGIGGIFGSLELAKAALIILKAREPDDYHALNIVEMELDVITPENPNLMKGAFIDFPAIKLG